MFLLMLRSDDVCGHFALLFWPHIQNITTSITFMILVQLHSVQCRIYSFVKLLVFAVVHWIRCIFFIYSAFCLAWPDLISASERIYFWGMVERQNSNFFGSRNIFWTYSEAKRLGLEKCIFWTGSKFWFARKLFLDCELWTRNLNESSFSQQKPPEFSYWLVSFVNHLRPTITWITHHKSEVSFWTLFIDLKW